MGRRAVPKNKENSEAAVDYADEVEDDDDDEKWVDERCPIP